MTVEPRIDAYIADAAPFARPILSHLRTLVHRASPEIDEAIKWSMPMFVYRGKVVANIAAFTAHAAFGTWQRDAAGKQGPVSDGMGRIGKLTGLDSLPSDEAIVALVRTAMAQVDAGGSIRDGRVAKPMPSMPDDLRAALDAVPAAAAFDTFGPGAQREYLDWVLDAKAPATRAKRIATTVEWAGEGKKRNRKYENC